MVSLSPIQLLITLLSFFQKNIRFLIIITTKHNIKELNKLGSQSLSFFLAGTTRWDVSGREIRVVGDNQLIIIIMLVLELSETEEDCRIAEMAHLVRLALQAHNFHPALGDRSPSLPRETYHGGVLLGRAQAAVGVWWRVRVGVSGVQLEVGLGSGEGVGGSVCGALRAAGEEVQEFVYLINNLALCDREGYFIFKQLTGQLFLRYKITKTRFLSNPHSRLKYLTRAVATATALFAEHLEHILFYYRFPGFALGDLEDHLQPQNHVPLKQETQNIIFLQHYFEAQRRERRGSSQDLYPTTHSAPSLTPLQTYTNFLFARSPEMERQTACRAQFETRLQSVQNLFKFQLETLVKDVSHRKKKNSELILTSIKIKERGKESLIGTGGYAEIIHGIYSYIPQASIYGLTQLPPRAEEESVMKNCSLVKKIGLQSAGEANASLENECNFLKYIRNRVCPYVAKYFCNSEGQEPFSNHEIYLEYYPNNLGECRMPEPRKMKVMEDVCMALLFLAEERLIHRDLKEVNIMVDRYHRGRLIDFGSVSNVTGSSKFKTTDEKVRSTTGYYLPYREATALCPDLEQRLSRSEYYSHETFDLYGLGKVMENEFYLTQVVGRSHFVRHNLMLLSQKCREVNPEDRWTIQQVAIFLRHLLLFSQLRREFWKWGFDPRFRAHELGSSYNGSGAYQWRQEEVVFRGRERCT